MPRRKNPFRLNKREIKKWKSRIQDAISVNENLKPEWESNINLYQNKMREEVPTETWVDVPKHFPLMELKKHQLFFKVPRIQTEATVVAKETFQEASVMISEAWEKVVNKLISRDELNLKKDIHKTLFDVLVPGGMGACEIGFRSDTRKATFNAGEPNPLEPTFQNPETGQDEPNLLQEDLSVDIPVYEEFFWDHFSLKDLLIPKDFRDSDHEKAPWLGRRFEMPLSQAKKKYKLGDDFKPSGNPEDFEVSPAGRRSVIPDVADGIIIWYRAYYFDSAVDNPELFRKLVFINGKEDPVEHIDSPHQDLDQDGKLTADSMVGNPIHVLGIRDITDSAHVPSDASMIKPLTRELSKGRSQMLTYRDRNIPMSWHDRNRVSPTDIAKWEKGIIGASLPVDGDGSTIFGEIRTGRIGSENFQFDAVINRDIQETVSMGSNQAGTITDERKSATELNLVQQNSSIRSDGEKDRVVEWFIIGLTKKLFPLVHRYADEGFYTKFIGQQGFQVLSQWLSSGIPAYLAFDTLPDSTAHYDAQVRLEQLFKAYEFMAKDPFFNRVPLMRKIMSFLDIDPFESVTDEPPEAKPEPPNISVRASGDDFNPMMPQFPVLKEVLQQLGIQMSAEAETRGRALADIAAALVAEQALGEQQNAQANPDGNHPGLAPKAELLSKRETTQGQPAEPGMQGL